MKGSDSTRPVIFMWCSATGFPSAIPLAATLGMKLHIGVDNQSGLAHSAVVTATNVHDKHSLIAVGAVHPDGSGIICLSGGLSPGLDVFGGAHHYPLLSQMIDRALIAAAQKQSGQDQRKTRRKFFMTFLRLDRCNSLHHGLGPCIEPGHGLHNLACDRF